MLFRHSRFLALATALLTAASCSVVNSADDPVAPPGQGGSAGSTSSHSSSTTSSGTNPFGGGAPGGSGPGGGGSAAGGAPPCGDGIVDSSLGETCDPPANCPSDCNDGNVCTLDQLQGSAADCTAECVAAAITECAADGCCADGCTAANDPDCTGCGVGEVVPPETCDGNCPDGCDDFEACTADSMQGSAASCNVVCSNEWIIACAEGDGCCPAACNYSVDSDCPAPTVLLVYATGMWPQFAQDVQTKQAATGAFTVVDLVDAGVATPDLEQLLAYDVVLVFMDGTWADPVLLGDNLADYFDAGGRVVQALFTLTSFGALQGRFGDVLQGYQLFDTTMAHDQPAASLGVIYDPTSPLMAGVGTLQAEMAYQTLGEPLDGTLVVAEWSTGRPLVVRGTVQGRNRVDLNLYPASADAPEHFGFWTGDGTALIRNALLFE
jgi:hypothetical protein